MVDRTQFFMQRNMQRYGRKKNTPSQKLAQKIINGLLLKKGITEKCEKEYQVTEIQPAGGYDLSGDRVPTLDLVLFLTKTPRCSGLKLAIFVNGGYHIRRENLDFIQISVLQHKNNGWFVVVFDNNTTPELFKEKPNVAAATRQVKQALKPVLVL